MSGMTPIERDTIERIRDVARGIARQAKAIRRWPLNPYVKSVSYSEEHVGELVSAFNELQRAENELSLATGEVFRWLHAHEYTGKKA